MSFARRTATLLFASALQGGVAFVMVPITTYLIGPAEIGAFGLLGTLANLGGPLAVLGGSFLLLNRYPKGSADERRVLVSSLLAVGLAALAVFCTAFLVGWPWLSRLADGLDALGRAEVGLALAAVVFTFPWYVAMSTLTIQGRAGALAWITVGQTLLGAAVTIVGLYVFEWGLLALFAGTASGAAVLGLGALVALKDEISPAAVEWPVVREALRLGLPTVAANVSDSVQGSLEAVLISQHSGLYGLGLFNHANRYRQLLGPALKALSSALLPVSLEEAHEEAGAFRRTNAVWPVLHIGLVLAALFFALLGREFVALLTHDRFTDAASFVPWLLLLLVVQHSQRAAQTYLHATGHGLFLARALFASTLLRALSLLLLVPRYGVPGAIAAELGSRALYRTVSGMRARAAWSRLGRPSAALHGDRWGLGGALVVVLTLGVVQQAEPSLGGRVAAFGLLSIGLLLAARETLRDAGAYALRALRASAAPTEAA